MIVLEDFMKMVEVEPSFVSKDLGDGVRIVSWKEIDGEFPSMEFGTKEGHGGQYLYYEIVDFGHGYSDGDVIPLGENNRRRDIIDIRLNEENEHEVISRINSSLKGFYG